jgi:hypothetical protein
VLRSKTPDLVRQEFYGLLMAHFAVRGLMHEAALKSGEDPDRLSFLHAVRVIHRKKNAPSSRNRHNPRAVKRKTSNCPRRLRGSKTLPPVDFSQIIRIVK